ncbi:MAG: nucleoside hydrolase [Micrococcales bacterium]
MTQFRYQARPKVRVISDNDYAGDPDGLVQLAHLLLTQVADVRAVVGSHIRQDVPWPVSKTPSTDAANLAKRVAQYCGYDGPVLVGAEAEMVDANTPAESQAVEYLIREALDDSSGLPLYVLCGGALTTVASAYLKEPRIAEKITLVTIGGQGYDEPEDSEPEFNFTADVVATQVIFNQSNIKIIQVPRSTYAKTMCSKIELISRMGNVNELGAFIWSKYEELDKFAASIMLNFGEVYILGDSPLVMISCFGSPLGGDESSTSHIRPMFAINDMGGYDRTKTGREIQVYDNIDNRLMMEDFFLKVKNL